MLIGGYGMGFTLRAALAGLDSDASVVVVELVSEVLKWARGPINATYGVTAGATYNAVFHVTDHHIPKNSGAYRPIRIIAPPGSAVNVVYPGPSVGGNTETHPKLADMVIAALAPALPERVAAAEGGTACNFLFGGVHPKTGDYYANYHLEGGGWGAKSYDDGNDAIIVKNGNCRNTPVEIFETRYLGEVTVKGKEIPVKIYTVVDTEPTAAPA